MNDTPSTPTYGNTGGYGAYKQTQQKSEDVRVTEAQALLRCASLLEAAQGADVPYLEYAEAVRHNQNLWTVFQAALVQDDNPLPVQLKDTLKGLSVYVDRRTLRALAEHKAELLTVLININKEIAGGLMDSYNASQKKDESDKAAAEDAKAKAAAMPRINTQIL